MSPTLSTVKILCYIVGVKREKMDVSLKNARTCDGTADVLITARDWLFFTEHVKSDSINNFQYYSHQKMQYDIIATEFVIEFIIVEGGIHVPTAGLEFCFDFTNGTQ